MRSSSILPLFESVCQITSAAEPGSEYRYHKPLAPVASFHHLEEVMKLLQHCPWPAVGFWHRQWQSLRRETSVSSAVRAVPWSRLAAQACAVLQRLAIQC